jgi:hypothetical protein
VYQRVDTPNHIHYDLERQRVDTGLIGSLNAGSLLSALLTALLTRNHRNASGGALLSLQGDFGELPHDRQGAFEPKLVARHPDALVGL